MRSTKLIFSIVCLLFAFGSLANAKKSSKTAPESLLLDCFNKLNYGACEKADVFCENGDGMACVAIGGYWLTQQDLSKSLYYNKRACLLGKTNSCDFYLKASQNESERAKLQGEIDDLNRTNRQRNITNSLGAASKFLNDNQQPTQQTTKCETKPVYGMDGRLIKYNTVCK
jgi:hypothetical protein